MRIARISLDLRIIVAPPFRASSIASWRLAVIRAAPATAIRDLPDCSTRRGRDRCRLRRPSASRHRNPGRRTTGTTPRDHGRFVELDVRSDRFDLGDVRRTLLAKLRWLFQNSQA
jgi:hypothetical protein